MCISTNLTGVSFVCLGNIPRDKSFSFFDLLMASRDSPGLGVLTLFSYWIVIFWGVGWV